ncbi:hypothetical protein BY996DRAFT_6712344 [Phakopsora pachyrhizi]|nr:hypothetical protein BY996DRAFT_6712344 [Phakopsora pachyrhizi]
MFYYRAPRSRSSSSLLHFFKYLLYVLGLPFLQLSYRKFVILYDYNLPLFLKPTTSVLPLLPVSWVIYSNNFASMSLFL